MPWWLPLFPVRVSLLGFTLIIAQSGVKKLLCTLRSRETWSFVAEVGAHTTSITELFCDSSVQSILRMVDQLRHHLDGLQFHLWNMRILFQNLEKLRKALMNGRPGLGHRGMAKHLCTCN